MTDKTDSKEREAFIRWYTDYVCSGDRRAAPVWDSGHVIAQAWKAGRASLAASAGSEPVAYAMFADNGNIRLWSKARIPHPDAKPLYLHPSPPEGMVGGWMPIETAPKDGTAILLGSRGGSWIGKWLPVYGSGYRPENPWSSLMLNHDHMGEKRCKPTHWMPLPPPPTTPAGSGKGEA